MQKLFQMLEVALQTHKKSEDLEEEAKENQDTILYFTSGNRAQRTRIVWSALMHGERWFDWKALKAIRCIYTVFEWMHLFGRVHRAGPASIQDIH